jgi:hypothetical protein
LAVNLCGEFPETGETRFIDDRATMRRRPCPAATCADYVKRRECL